MGKSLFGKKCVDCEDRYKDAGPTKTYPNENLCVDCLIARFVEKNKSG